MGGVGRDRMGWCRVEDEVGRGAKGCKITMCFKERYSYLSTPCWCGVCLCVVDYLGCGVVWCCVVPWGGVPARCVVSIASRAHGGLVAFRIRMLERLLFPASDENG